MSVDAADTDLRTGDSAFRIERLALERRVLIAEGIGILRAVTKDGRGGRSIVEERRSYESRRICAESILGVTQREVIMEHKPMPP